MPSHLIHGALAQMYYDLDGAPWHFITWKALTGVRNGLFPADDNQLPIGWNRQTAQEVSSFFDQFRACMTEDEKINFSSVKKKGQNIPGRTVWRDFVSKVWKNGKIHEKITEILSAENLHPYALAAQSDSSDSWPPANMWVPLAIDPVALALFGEECYSDGTERVRSCLRSTTGALITRTWLVLYNALNRSKKKIDALELAAIRAFEDLDRDKLTMAKLRVVVDKVVKWKQVVQALHTMEGEEKIEEMESELGRLMVGLDEKVKPISTKKTKSLCQVTAQMLQSLASQEDVADIINLYRACFNPLAGDSSQLEGQVASVSFKFGTRSDGADPGTEVESTIPPSRLSHNLGFVHNIPILFNTHRRVDGVTPWDDPTAFENMDRLKTDETFTPNELRWHQLAGVHAMLRRLLSEESSVACPGILIADEVGLGKTLQSLAIIAWLTECSGRQSNEGSPLPPILAERPYLGESNSIPNDSHLIIVPGTVLNQWVSEIRIFLNPKAFDLFVYQTGEDFRKDFWSDSGPFALSNQPCANKIILAPHSALSQEFSLLYKLPKSSAKELPWRKPLQTPTYSSNVQKTLFGLNFLSVTIDEAHEFRNAGAKHSSALAILENAKIRMIMTATPLQTSTKDLASMGRLVGINFFFSQKAYDEEKDDTKELRRAKAALGEDYNPLDVEENDDDPIREIQAMIALRIQGQFEQRVLRRTIDSKNWLGENLIRLPALHEHVVLLALQPFEQEIHSKLAERLRDELSSCSATKAFSSTFYLPSRMGATYPRLSLTDKIPRFKTLEDWQSRKSTKVDICARMCLHLLSRDDAPSLIFEDGTVIFPEVPKPMPGEQISQKMKILIYQDFPMFGPLVRDVFTLYSISHLYMDGHTSYTARAKMVQKFNTDPAFRVLFFTSVGASGLNLTKASVVIFLDQPWSAQDERQIRGRVYRQGQDKEVHSYHLLADETSDVVLSALARGKKNMLETFLQQPQGQEFLDLMTHGVTPNEEDYLNDNEKRRVEMERARDMPKPKPRKKNADVAKPSAKLQGKSKPNPEGNGMESSQTGSTIVSDMSSETGSSVPLEQEQTHMAPKPKPKPRKLEKKPKPNLQGSEMEKSRTGVDEARARESDIPSSIVAESQLMSAPTFAPHNDQYAPKTPPEAEVGQRRGRPQYGSEPDSPQAKKEKKRPRVELVSYASSPEKQEGRRSSSCDSDIEMLDHFTETTSTAQHRGNQGGRLANVVMFGSQSVNSLKPSFSTANRSNDTLPIASDDEESCGSETVAQGKRIQDSCLVAKKPFINSLTQSFSTAKITTATTPIASDTGDNPNPIATLSPSPRPISSTPFHPSAVSQQLLAECADDIDGQQAHAEQERQKMKSALKAKIRAYAKPMSEEEKLKYKNLHDFKVKFVSEKIGEAGPSSVNRRKDTPDIRRPSILGQSERLSPPPRTTLSQNPYSRKSSKQTKSKWE